MIEESNLACDRIQRLVDDAIALVESNSLSEKRKQLQQITSTIENLNRIGVAVPQELAALSDTLTQEAAQHDVAMQTLQLLHERLDGLVDVLEPYVRVRGTRRRVRRQDLPEITDEEEFYPIIVEVLREMGGSGTARRILESIFHKMEVRLTPGDLECYPNTDRENWRRTAKIARQSLVERGVLRSDSPQQTWELAETQTVTGEN